MSNYKFLIRFYLLGFIQESTSRSGKFIERFGGDDTDFKKNRRTVEKLDEIFNPLSDLVRELIKLGFVDELKVKDVAGQTGLTYNKVYRLYAEPIREVKKLAKGYYKG